ncbi:SRPBCC family protein [Methylibium sp.]|uniref:SRPBCC family protein n=1 Tax=Methylibium sp. TaxID=2067992 RepID=UPI003D1354C7
MFKTLALAVLAALALLLLYAATRPDQFRVERSLRIEAPPERVFALIEDLKGFNTWNPYARKDPAIKQRYGDVTRGPGAFYAWESKEVGVGSMKITDTAAPTHVTIALDFEQPFTAHNTAEFALRPDGGGTTVTWAMHGPATFVSKLMGVFFSMDRMVGRDFEAGLVNLKAAAEAR